MTRFSLLLLLPAVALVAGCQSSTPNPMARLARESGWQTQPGGTFAATGVVSIKGAGKLARLTTEHDLVKINFPGFGMITREFRAGVLTSVDPYYGKRPVTGREAQLISALKAFDPRANLYARFSIARLPGTITAGTACDVMRFTPRTGPPLTVYFNEATGLIRRFDTELILPPDQRIPIRVLFEQYRQVNGIQTPMRCRIETSVKNVQLRLQTFEQTHPADPLQLAVAAAYAAHCIPSVDDIIARNTRAMGGDAYVKLKTIQAKGVLTVAGIGLQGKFQMQAKAPDKVVAVMDIPGMGRILQGSDGKTAWSLDPIFGNRELEGKEAEIFKQTGRLDLARNYKEYFKDVELLPPAEVDNQPCDVIKFTPAAANPITMYFERKTGLVRKQVTVFEGPQGTIKASTLMQKYKSIDGVMMPLQLVQWSGELKITIDIKDVVLNKPVADAVFARPPEEE